MDAAQQIRESFAEVERLREHAREQPVLAAAVVAVKRLQSRRFAGSYADLMAAGPYAAAARFFLEELYSDKDYAERDMQFARIAGAIEKVFPAWAVGTAVALARLHAQTEALDHGLGAAWLETDSSQAEPAARYVAAWRRAGRRAERDAQLAAVLDIGQQMARLTRTTGLRTLLRMMRTPASAAGLGSLQQFLEAGFDTFGALAGKARGVEGFLAVIEQRESALLAMLFDAPLVACVTELDCILGQAR